MSLIVTRVVLYSSFVLPFGVAQPLCNGLPRVCLEFDSRWERCKNRASRPSQGTVNGGAALNDSAVDGTLNTTNQPTVPESDSYTDHCPSIYVSRRISRKMPQYFNICCSLYEMKYKPLLY